MPEIECTECGWQGYITDLLCTDEDFSSTKSIIKTNFDICPDCGSVDTYEDYEY
jgi:NMD protein affecting ribosome stability and mRNA decay